METRRLCKGAMLDPPWKLEEAAPKPGDIALLFAGLLLRPPGDFFFFLPLLGDLLGELARGCRPTVVGPIAPRALEDACRPGRARRPAPKSV